jgi:hypothetical protein
MERDSGSLTTAFHGCGSGSGSDSSGGRLVLGRKSRLDPRAKTLPFTKEYWRSADGSKPSRVTERGRMGTEAPFPDGTVWPPCRQAALEELPTYPDGLLAAVTRWFGAGRSPEVDHETRYWP